MITVNIKIKYSNVCNRTAMIKMQTKYFTYSMNNIILKVGYYL
jgi:hypothetical protein